MCLLIERMSDSGMWGSCLSWGRKAAGQEPATREEGSGFRVEGEQGLLCCVGSLRFGQPASPTSGDLEPAEQHGMG